MALAVLLLVVCSLAIFGSSQLHHAINTAQKSSTTSDAYQDARFFAEREDATRASFRLGPNRWDLAGYNQAANSLDSTLQLIARAETVVGSQRERGLSAAVVVVHIQAQALTRREFRLLFAGQRVKAAELDDTRVDPIMDTLTTELGALEEVHHQSTVRQLAAAERDGTMLQIGTPIVLGLTLLLIGAFVLVTRGYRRTVERQALHDALTDLPNRRLFVDRVDHALAGTVRTRADPVVMLLDLDHFKDVNDTLGHHYGDLLLIEVAARLQREVRPVDTVARLGGDEFAVLLVDGGSAAGTQVAIRILQAFEAPFSLAGITVGLEASIGIASTDVVEDESTNAATDDADTRMPDLLQNADLAMYQAKKDRSGFRHYAAGQAGAAPAHLTLLGELRQAFERDELLLHFQPKIALETGDLVGVEALVRWQHPTRGLLPPGDFIALAEGTTLIHRLTEIVLDKALRLNRMWRDRGVEIPVAVNVSARTLLDPGFAANVALRLAHAGVPAPMLCLELTESTIMSNPDGALAVLHQLHDMGVRLSVDDFGTGYSSMSYLKVLPVDELKVDRSFVRDMTTDLSDNVLVQSAVDLGHNLGLTVVAEGVEDLRTLNALRVAGADIVQGFYLGRPMTADLLEQWLTAHVNLPAAEILSPIP